MNAVIVDSGGANVASLRWALLRLGCEATVSRSDPEIRAASHVLLPGVGAAGDTMRRLADFDLVDTIRELRQPVLGICLGMQILFERSAENSARGLGIIAGSVEGLTAAPGRPVPHMGWNRVRTVPDCDLFGDVPDGAHFYFVHSFAAPPGPNTVASTTYGPEFSAAVASDNFWGTQFHPERSGGHGAQVLANFLGM